MMSGGEAPHPLQHTVVEVFQMVAQFERADLAGYVGAGWRKIIHGFSL
jgi:hypothetical protein